MMITHQLLAAIKAMALASIQFDGGGICDNLEHETRELFTKQQHLPHGTAVEVSFAPQLDGDGATVTMKVTPPNESPSEERHQVNSCEEGYKFVEFYLELWDEPTEQGAARPASTTRAPGQLRKPNDERSPTERRAAEFPVTKVGVSVFAAAGTNYPDGLGLGQGASLSLGLPHLRLGLSGIWMTPAVLESSVLDAATYFIERTDWRALGCLESIGLPGWLAPCLGAGVTRWNLPAARLAPGADTRANSWFAEVGVGAFPRLLWGAGLDASLLVRHAINSVDYGEIGKNRFTPGRWELMLSLGFAYDFSFTRLRDASRAFRDPGGSEAGLSHFSRRVAGTPAAVSGSAGNARAVMQSNPREQTRW